MNNQFKPSKPQKLKSSKPAKEPKTPKAPKAEKAVNLGSAKAVKFDKPKKEKTPKKVKEPKTEKVAAFKPSKAEKVESFDSTAALKKPVNKKIIAIALVCVAVVALAIVLVFTLRDNEVVIEPSSLYVDSLPSKTTFYVGEADVFTGLKLKMVMTNGAEITIDGSDCEISGFDSSKPAEAQVITVKYKNLSTSFAIDIKEMLTDPPTGNYNGLSFKTLPKTNYNVGEWIDTSEGVLLVHYDDGTTRELSLDSENVKIYDFTTDKPGKYTITVKYVEATRYGETSYEITVTE